ncbi:MAG: alpha-ketoacid dehydrogenase subunit beta [Chloroflexi bacterium]|nr:alpha-ketoacid dehydrogenase subunit beta [Chloroflexota bacterium]
MAVKTIAEAVRDTLREAMQQDDRIIVIGEDVGLRGGVFRITEGLMQEFGEERVIDAPLAESGIVGVAIGAALHGLLPVAEIQFADFIHPAFDQIMNEAAKIRYRSNNDFHCPLVIRVPYGGGVHGALYHSQSIEALLGHIPGLKVVAPATPYDAKGMLRAAIADPDPVIFLEHKRTYRLIKGEVPEGSFTVPLDRAEVRRQGRTIALFSYGLMLHYALEAAERVAQDGIDTAVIDLRTIAPLDRPTILEWAQRCGKVLIAYEDNKSIGAGAEVAALIAEEAFDSLDGPILRVATPDVPAMPFSPPLERHVMPNVDTIEQALRRLAAY